METLWEEGQYMWDKVVNRNYGFSEKEEMLDFLVDITYPQAKAFFEKAFTYGKVSLQSKEELLGAEETFSKRAESREIGEVREMNCFYNY